MKYLKIVDLVMVLFIGSLQLLEAQTYNQTNSIFKDKLDESIYNTDVRPVLDQSKMMEIYVTFELVSIVEINDVTQSVLLNGFLAFVWVDEMVAWDPNDYGGQVVIYPIPEKIWRPRLVLVNTLGDRDLFDDDKAPTFVKYDGTTGWAPGSLFPTSCELNLANYPFDKQTCTIKLVAMRFTTEHMQFVAITPDVASNYFSTNGEWDVQSTELIITNFSSAGSALSCIEMKFHLKRRPTFLILNIILPVVFLSFLNILVFVIPVESGEKIGYGITVLLALSVFMSIVSGMLPRSSVNMPNVTIYLFFLLFLSMLTVIDSIIIVYLHHKEGEEAVHLKVTSHFKGALSKVTRMRNVISSFDVPEAESMEGDTARKVMSAFGSKTSLTDKVKSSSGDKGNKQNTELKQGDAPKVNKYKLIGKHIDSVSFIVFFLIWLASTLGFMLDMALT